MTGSIATRPLKYFSLVSSPSHEEIIATRPLRCGFIESTATITTVSNELKPGTFEVVTLSDVSLVYDALVSGEIDAFFYTGTAEANFVENCDITSAEFYPLIYRPVSLTTRVDELKPIISIVDRVLENGGMHYLTTLYNQAYQEYLIFKLYTRLTDEERAFIRNNPEVRIGIDPGNYPGCFFDSRVNEWKGISLDILDEIASLSGLTFERANNEHTEWPEIYAMLVTGDIAMVPEMNQTAERIEMGYFIWSENVQMVDYYALISDTDFPDIMINEVLYVKVGLARNTAYTDIFNKWFPDHNNTILYDSVEDAFDALKSGEVDMVMANRKRLLYLTNFLELPNYKVNIKFDYSIDIKFAFNRSETILASIVDKAMVLVDMQRIADNWMSRTYDYRTKVVEAQQPLLIGIIILFTSLLLLVAVLFFRSRYIGKQLEDIVDERTSELEEALKSANAASQAKSDFLASMSHEIRTPMNSIVGFSELALDGNVTIETREYLTNILVNSEDLLQIINDILDISKIETGKMELENVPFDPHDLFSSCRTIIMPKAIEKGLQMHFYAEPPEGKVPLGDPTRLRQVLLNLLSNALKFTNSGIIRLQASVIDMSENTVSVYIEVKDTGIGMTQDQIKMIFEPFVQGESGTTRKYGGTGLGLTIAKRILEEMGTELSVESIPGIGSKFSFGLTFETIDEPAEDMFINHFEHAELRKPTFEGEILLCEDNVMNQQVICEHLARVGIKTTVAENGKVGVDYVRNRVRNNEKMYDLIFMDMHMPVMDGLEASAIIDEMKLGVPIVAMTANIMSSDKELYELCGMSGYMGKPFTSQELWSCLMKYFKPIKWQSVDEGSDDAENDELRQKLINKFVETNTLKFEEIVDALRTGDIKLAHRLAHTLKSNAGQLGQMDLQQAAKDVEDDIKDGEYRIDTPQMKLLSKELDAVIKELIPMVKEPNISTTAIPLSPNEAHKLLDELIHLLQDNDPECLSYVDKLHSIPGSEKLIRQMENFDFNLAVETAAELNRKIEK